MKLLHIDYWQYHLRHFHSKDQRGKMSKSKVGMCQLAIHTPCTIQMEPITHEALDEKTSQLLEMPYDQAPLSKTIMPESHTCTKRLMIGHLNSTSYNPPVNFSKVSEGLYRSGYPQVQDYPFIQSLKLKTIVTLVGRELPDGYQEFMHSNCITHKIFEMAGTKKEEVPIELMRSIIAVVSNLENYPLLIHCNHGRHRTGCVVGVLRKTNDWDTERIIDEYITFAAPKVRETDVNYLAKFELASLELRQQATGLPGTFGRFCKFILVALLAIYAFYPLGKLRIPEPHPESS
ncbi:hypothetical protein F5Y19DRAFT_208802 [Xylariaceae sp. FL1651]|nr:hypothetical protein F5Y19DRAFT_208802 [Xylariaceae sp. FL1651]